MSKIKNAFILFMDLLVFINAQTVPVIQTKTGFLRGKLVETNLTATTKVQMYAWLSIPYAKAPVGNLRFKRPEAYGAWSGVLNATQNPPQCMQKAFSFGPAGAGPRMSEDCLFLNVYSPIPMSSNMPVMVKITYFSLL